MRREVKRVERLKENLYVLRGGGPERLEAYVQVIFDELE